MRQVLWQNILSVRTFPVGFSRGMARSSVMVSAVPRLKRRVGVAVSRGRGRSILEVGNGFSGTRRSSDKPGKVHIRKVDGIVHPSLFSKRAECRTDMFSRPVLSASSSASGSVAFLKRISCSVERKLQGVGARKRPAPAGVRGTASARHPAPIVAIATKRRSHSMEAGSRVLSKVVRTGTGRKSGAAVRGKPGSGVNCVPAVRRAVVSGQSHEGVGQAYARHQDVLETERHHEPEAPDVHVNNEAGNIGFLLGNRRSRLAARRSGGGVDEIMQPQYPGRSIGFF